MESIKKYSTLVEADDEDAGEKETFYIYYFDESNERKDIKDTTRLSFAKKFANQLVENPKKLNSIGATGLFVDDSEDRNVFTAFRNDDDTWDIEEDNFDDFYNNIYLGSEYRDTLLNRIIYSITATSPENLKHYNPSLAAGLVKVDSKDKITDDIWGHDFRENGDAVINITLNKWQVPKYSHGGPTEAKEKSDQIIQSKKDMLKRVCDHYGVKLEPFGERAFSIIVPDQMKYYDD